MTSSHSVPDRTHLQRMEALRRGNRIRTQRSHVKRDLKAGRVDPIVLIADPPEWLYTFKVIDLLIACPKKGRVRANAMLKHCGISPSKTVEGLSDRQRRDLLAELRGGSR